MSSCLVSSDCPIRTDHEEFCTHRWWMRRCWCGGSDSRCLVFSTLQYFIVPPIALTYANQQPPTTYSYFGTILISNCFKYYLCHLVTKGKRVISRMCRLVASHFTDPYRDSLFATPCPAVLLPCMYLILVCYVFYPTCPPC